MIGPQAHGPDGTGAVRAAIGDFTDPDGGIGTGSQSGGAGRAVEDAVEIGAVPGGKGPGRRSVRGAQTVGLVLDFQRVEEAEFGGAGHQHQRNRVGQGSVKTIFGQENPVRKQVGEAAHPNAAPVGHQQANPGRVQIVEPAGDILAVGEKPGGGLGLVGEQPVLHRQGRKGCGGLAGAGIGVGHGQTAGQGHRFLEPPGKIGAGQHGQHIPAARRKAHGGDVAGIAAEGGNVFLDPVEGPGGVQQGVIAGTVGTVLEGGQAVEAQQPQPVTHRYKDASGPGGQAGARQFLRGTGAVAAAVKIDHHRQAGGAVGGPDVQFEAVLGAGGHPVAGLERHGSRCGAVQGIRPGCRVLGRLPPQRSRRGCAVGHPVPDQAAFLQLLALDRTAGGGPEGAPQGRGRGVRLAGPGRQTAGQPRRRQGSGFQKAAP